MKASERPLYEVAKIRDLRDMLTQSLEKFSEKAAFLLENSYIFFSDIPNIS